MAGYIDVLTSFRLLQSYIVQPGGRKSPVAEAIDHAFYNKGWEEKNFQTKVVVDQREMASPTHAVDCYKNHIAVEIEWNNKDPFLTGI